MRRSELELLCVQWEARAKSAEAKLSEIARLQAELAEARAGIAGAHEAFNSILCNAVEGPEVMPAADLFQAIAKEANTAMRSLSGYGRIHKETP